MALPHDTWCELQTQATDHQYLRKARKELQKQMKQVAPQKHRSTKAREYPLLRIALRNSYLEKEDMVPVRQGNAVILAPKMKEAVTVKIMNIQDLPDNVLAQIFAFAEPCAAACFGLTSSKFYPFLKNRYPNPIPLDLCSGIEWCWSKHYHFYYLQTPTLLLGHLLNDEFEGKYELARIDKLGENQTGVRWILLANDIHGGWAIRDDRVKKMKDLAHRYQDWSVSDRQDSQWALGTFGYALPNPHNVDPEVWKKMAISSIKLDIWRFDSGDWKRWYAFWERADVFRKNRSLFRETVEKYIGEKCEDVWYWEASDYQIEEIVEEREVY